ncbi:MAG TPA: alpha-L-fucosidase [Paludibacter sp.]
MKKINLFSYAVLVCMLFGFLETQAQCYTPLFPSGNIVTDPECNTANVYKSWGNYTQITGSLAYCGTSVRVTGGCGGSLDYSLTGKLLPNTSYRLKCMLYSDKDASITLNGCGINGLTSDYQIVKNTGSTWQTVDFYFITGTLASAQNLWINSCSGSNRATDIRLDNLEIYPATEPVVEIPMEPMDSGKFVPTWESLKQYGEAPEWYQDAKFGIWAHWGPQCQPEQGDWFARFMYYSGGDRNWFTNKYGSDTKLGFKEVINDWKAENWQPDSIVKLYKDAGAKYFFALGNHHDNLDLWDSKYQPWNTVKVGPKKDLIAGWEKATRANGLRFGVSIHASHAWSWYEPSQSYDGNLTAADGAGKWWDGLDPQELYAQNHAHSSGWDNSGTIHSQWNWVSGASIPSKAYCAKFYNRTIDMIKKYNPDLIYFDDTSLPLVAVDAAGNRSTTTVSDVGLKIAASYYNKSANANNGKVENVIFGKILTPDEKECLVWDVERGIPDKPQAKHWQTCTCIGDWHYSRSVYNNNKYKSANTVIHMLIDIVSKNGNLLLNVPLRGDGTYDEKELAVVKGITAWMNVNKESIYDTRTWTIFGEGPTAERANALSAQGFNEGTSYDANDIRYVKKGDSLLYVTVMGWPTGGKAVLKTLGLSQPYLVKGIKNIQILGGGNLTYTRNADGLSINLPATKPATADIGIAFKISLDTAVNAANLGTMIRIAEVNDSIAKLNTGTNCGQFTPEAVAALETAIDAAKAKTLVNCNCLITAEQINAAVDTLKNAIITFQTAKKSEGGFTPLYETGNLVTDPQCSNYPNASSGWSKNWGNGASISDAKAFCGSSIQVTGSCGGSIDYTLTGKLLPNTKYRLKCMLYSDKEAYITLNGMGINGSTSDYQVMKNTGGAWQAVDFNFTTGTLASAQNLWLNSCTGSNRATDIRLDNFELYNMSLLSSVKTVGVDDQNIYIQGNSIVVDFELAQPSEVEISVFNAQGILVKKVNGDFNAGKNRKVINANLASGVCFVKVDCNGQMVTKKLMK